MFIPKCKTNIHLNRIGEFFGEIAVRPDDIDRSVDYVFICFTNRCGSNYLASFISSNLKINTIGEVFNFDTVQNLSTANDINSFGEYFRFITSRSQKSDRVFFKTAISHIELLCRAGILDQIMPRSKFILVTRGDKLGQAISVAIAFATGQFTSAQPEKIRRQDVPFSRRQIETIINGIAEEYQLFHQFFGHNGIIPITLSYELFSAYPEAHLGPLAHELGMAEFSVLSRDAGLRKQRDTVNKEWREAFLRG